MSTCTFSLNPNSSWQRLAMVAEATCGGFRSFLCGLRKREKGEIEGVKREVNKERERGQEREVKRD